MTITHGDCLEVMRSYPDNHFSGILTDPPYGLSFMGKSWDHSVPGKEFWIEALRICKPGAMMLCFGGTRTYHRLACAIEDAGWEIRDCLQWVYGSGFPKSHNKFGLKGYGTALKPAYEPILLCMSPVEGTFAHNSWKWGQAGINIDGCRIGNEKIEKGNFGRKQDENKSLYKIGLGISESKQFSKGRWPANILFDEDAANMLDEQSGVSKSQRSYRGNTKIFPVISNWVGESTIRGHNDSGGASRFFYCAKASSAERNRGCGGLLLKNSVYSKEAKNGEGIGISNSKLPKKNNHPTVKPLKLLEYLLKLISPPQNALILDPFAGSGSTCVAAKQLGIDCIGIEIDAEYCAIARARIASAKHSNPDQELNLGIN